MLVLSRKKNESIQINDDISIVVVEIRGDKVRLGIEAPKDYPVHRQEVADAIAKELEQKDGRKIASKQEADTGHDTYPASHVKPSVATGPIGKFMASKS